METMVRGRTIRISRGRAKRASSNPISVLLIQAVMNRRGRRLIPIQLRPIPRHRIQCPLCRGLKRGRSHQAFRCGSQSLCLLSKTGFGQIKMRVYFSQGSDPMITDSVVGLNALAFRLAEFLATEDKRLFIVADTSASPQPYDALLAGVEFEKGTGPILVSLDSRQCLRVTGSIENLRTWCSFFVFPPDAKEGTHHHPEYVDRSEYIDRGTLSTIIEVRDAS
jgi:hypothetical protein